MTNYLTNENGDAINPRQPLPVDDLTSNETVSQSETLTYTGKVGTGAVVINATTYQPIMSIQGDRVASYWGLPENLVYTTRNVDALTETAGSADVTITDPDNDLELLFETAAAPWRYVLRVTDYNGDTLYGWVAGVAVATNAYTFTVYSTRAGTTQDWVGTLGDYSLASGGAKLEIFRATSSLALGTGTTLTEEVKNPAEYRTTWKELTNYAKDLSDGQYFVDYMRGLIIGKRADATAGETITYNIWTASTSSPSVVSSKVNISATAEDIGGDPFFDSDGDNTAQALKASAGNIYKVTVDNTNTAIAYVQFFDTAAGSVIVGTTPPIYVLPVPKTGGSIDDFNGVPLSFATAISYACTTTPTGNGDPTTGLTVSGVYK